jgi:sporulation protein YlmC with PRC-barrel domain
MNKINLAALSLLILTFVAVPAFAAQSEVGKTPMGASTTQQQASLFERASQLIGKEVVNSSNEDLGKIHDVILNKQGQASFVILSHGGLLGMGDKLVPIPWNMVASAIAKENGRDRLVFNLTKDQVDKAPTFDNRNYPNFADASFRDRVNSYFAGASPAAGTGYTETR